MKNSMKEANWKKAMILTKTDDHFNLVFNHTVLLLLAAKKRGKLDKFMTTITNFGKDNLGEK